MSLSKPWFLLLILPVLAWFFWSIFGRRRVRYSPIDRLKASGVSLRTLFWWLPEALLLAFFVVWAILLAGPERDLDPLTSREDGLSIQIVLDRSGSMQALVPYEGKSIRRIDGVKLVTRSFLQSRTRDQIGLISFARYPETHTPLTTNRQVLLDFLDLIELPTTREEDGTAIGDGLVLAAARVSRNTPEKGRVIILMTDGRNNAGSKTPEEGADLAVAQKATVYAIGLGGEGTLIQETPFGRQQVSARVDIDEDQLSRLSAKTGGRYIRANNLTDLASLYEQIATTETVKLTKNNEKRSELNLEWGLYVLAFVLLSYVLTRFFVLKRGDL